MSDKLDTGPENTAVRVALWRALHVEIDSPPHVLEDVVGLQLVAPDEGWRDRPDMSTFTRPFRASILARARFIEDLVAEQVARGVAQYVILGAGLDTFAQRRPELASRLLVFEIDQPIRLPRWARHNDVQSTQRHRILVHARTPIARPSASASCHPAANGSSAGAVRATQRALA